MPNCGPTYNEIVANKVECISFNNIINLAVIDLASIGVTNIKDLLTIDEHIDGLDVVMAIMKKSIDRFEYLNPFGIALYPYLVAGQPYTFTDNFQSFLEGKVDRSNLQLIPRAIVAIVSTYLGTLRGIRYEPPTMHNITYTGQYRVQVIANRPYKMERSKDNGFRLTDESVYYYISENTKEILYRFRMLFQLNLAEHIIRLNENLEHPNLPINTFQGLQNYVSNLRSEHDELERESFSYYPIYSDNG